MDKSIFPYFLFPNLAWFQSWKSCDAAELEVCENWVKQTLRNRYEIAGPNGRQSLSVPTIKSTRKTFKDVKISYAEDWVTHHQRSVKTAYNRSPYFEYYQDGYNQILSRKPEYLLDLNQAALEWLFSKLQIDQELVHTKEYQESGITDLRQQDFSADKGTSYLQVFDEKLGFMPNLSALDVLFNCGPEAGSYLV